MQLGKPLKIVSFLNFVASLGLLLGFPAHGLEPQGTPNRSPAAAAFEDATTRKLRAAVQESQSKLGDLEPWQKKIFEEEAVPQYQRFIRDYRSSQTHSGTAVSNLAVDIDLESLKNYLRFYAPKALARSEKDATILMYLRSDRGAPNGDGCEKCVAAGPGLRKLALARVQRRGFKPIWITLDDLGVEDEPQGKSLDDKVAELASKRNAAGSLVIQWGPAPVDDIDTAHADEKRYVIHSSLRVRGISGLAVAKANTANSVPGKVEGRMELLENDSFETSAARLLTDEFTDLGGQTARIEAALGKSAGQPVEGDDSEVAIEISGVQDFAQLGRVKAQIQARLTNNSVEERKISRTHLTLAVPGEKSAETVKARLTGLDGVVITSAADGVIQMEARQ